MLAGCLTSLVTVLTVARARRDTVKLCVAQSSSRRLLCRIEVLHHEAAVYRH